MMSASCSMAAAAAGVSGGKTAGAVALAERGHNASVQIAVAHKPHHLPANLFNVAVSLSTTKRTAADGTVPVRRSVRPGKIRGKRPENCVAAQCLPAHPWRRSA